jgi:copper chaperone CopZ
MSFTLKVKNIKCNGCVNNIRTKLSADPRIKAVEVRIEGGEVEVDADAAIQDEVVTTLTELGYPPAA